ASYRPISLTINISKIYERLIKIQLMTHADDNKIIPDNQFGFRARHSTVHAINKFSSDINKHLLNGKLVGAVLIDLEKAFDSIWLNGLIYVLITLNFPVNLIMLIYDMVHGKSFITWDGINLSTLTFTILEGLQQGTVTSPILFIIYTSSILNILGLNSGNNSHSGVYADDEVAYVADSKIPIIQDRLTKIVNEKYKTYKLWNLKMNPEKSVTILFRKTVNEITPPTVRLIKTFQITVTDKDTGEEFPIPNQKVKYLGINFDYLLRMNKHHTIQLNKAKKAFRANSRIFCDRNIDSKAKLICYQLLVRPIMSYAAPIWWNIGPSVMEKYRKFERSCLKKCLGRYRSPESNYLKYLSNKEIYNLANIPRFDNFCLTLTRNYFSTINEIDNNIIKNLKIENIELIKRMTKSNYSPPE
ncbi:GSCOCG00012164001-RA-CDS, partial [Cotesia congregata]